MFDALILSGIFISLLAGQFARIELISALANIYVHEFFLLIFIIYSVARFGLGPIIKIYSSKISTALLFILFATFLLPFHEFTLIQNGLASLYLLRAVLYILFGVYFVELLHTKKQLKTLLYNLIYSFSILLLITTAIQYIFYPNFWVLKPLGWDPHTFRASSAYFDIFIAAALYGVFVFFWASKRNYILSFLFMIALVLTFSRSSYLAFGLSLLYFFIAQRKWKVLLISLCLFAPKPSGEGVNLLRTASINSRIADYKLGLQIWQEKPFFGFGYNRIRYAKEQLNLVSADDRSHSLSSFHSSFLMVLVTTGIVGFGLFVALIISFYKKYPALRVYIIYILTMSLFDNVLLHVLVVLPLIFIATCLAKSSSDSYSSLE